MKRPWRQLAAVLALGLLALPGAVRGAAPSATRRMVIIDQDTFGPAGSNLQAILMLLQSGDVDLLGITVPSGDGWRDEEVSDALRLLEIAGRTDVRVYPGAVYPLVNTPQRTKLWEQLYGRLFYQGAWTESWPAEGTVRRSPYHADPFLVPPSPAGQPSTRPAAESAADFLIRSVRAHPGQVTIIAAGPLTDIALAARLDPQFAALAREFVFTGRQLLAGVGRQRVRERVCQCPASGVQHALGSGSRLDCPARAVEEDHADPDRSDHAPFDAYLGQFGQPYPMWDELAVAVWLDPSIVTRSASLLVDVDTSFTAGYGNTLSWAPGSGPGLGERPVLVIQEVDVPRFERLTLGLLSRAAPDTPTRAPP